jgi:hypothetical protein
MLTQRNNRMEVEDVAQVTKVSLVDDLDGSEADETVSFGLDGKGFVIDLTAKHASELRNALAPFVASARRAGRATSTRTTTTRSATTAGDRERNAAVRAWAKENGFDVSERGRLSAAVLKAYEERGSTPAVVGKQSAVAEEKPTKRTRKKVDA